VNANEQGSLQLNVVTAGVALAALYNATYAFYRTLGLLLERQSDPRRVSMKRKHAWTLSSSDHFKAVNGAVSAPICDARREKDLVGVIKDVQRIKEEGKGEVGYR
jgi:hypothetical protein